MSPEWTLICVSLERAEAGGAAVGEANPSASLQTPRDHGRRPERRLPMAGSRAGVSLPRVYAGSRIARIRTVDSTGIMPLAIVPSPAAGCGNLPGLRIPERAPPTRSGSAFRPRTPRSRPPPAARPTRCRRPARTARHASPGEAMRIARCTCSNGTAKASCRMRRWGCSSRRRRLDVQPARPRCARQRAWYSPSSSGDSRPMGS